MSVFDEVPHPFPLDVPLRRLPVEFDLRVQPGERGVLLLMSAFWAIAVPAGLIGMAEPWKPWAGDPNWPFRAVLMVALAVFVVLGYGRWLGPMMSRLAKTARVRITASEVAVEERGLLGRRRWTCPLAEFSGVGIEDWGRLQQQRDKSRLLAVVLKHPNARRSIPIVIDKELRVKASVAERKAAQLGVPVLATAEGVGQEQLLPGTLVVNRWQAFKVRLLLAFAGGGAALVAAWAGWQGWLAGDWLPLALGGGAMALAAATFAFAGRYVTGLRVLDEQVEIVTAVPFRPPYRVPVSAIRSARRRRGRSGQGTALPVDAPWIGLKVDGFRGAFVVDLQAEVVNVWAIEALASAQGRRPARAS
jgi:hypothetical protein